LSDPYADMTMDKINKRYSRKELEKALIFEGDIDVTQVASIMDEQVGYMRIMSSMVPTVDFGMMLEGRSVVFDNLRMIEEVITEVDEARRLLFRVGNLSLPEYQIISMHRLRAAILSTGVSQ